MESTISHGYPYASARIQTGTNCSEKKSTPPNTPTPAPAAAARAASRRGAPTSRKRLMVWDLDSVFPALTDTLRQMSKVQAVFNFETASLSAPLDVWDVDQKAPDGTPYLMAERLAHRMEGAAPELDAEVIVCITRHWMRSDDTLNLYGWWPRQRKPPVVVLSFAGFDGLLTQGVQTDRALANLVVSALAGFFGGMAAHNTGSHDCPMWHNPGRLLSPLTKAQQFDRACRTHLEQSNSRELEAFDAILNAFS